MNMKSQILGVSTFLFFLTSLSANKYDTLRDLVPFVQFKKRKKYPYGSGTFSKVAGLSL